MRRRIILTDSFAAHETTGQRDRLIMDAGCEGLRLRLRPSGGKRYICVINNGGGQRYHTIGDPALITITKARQICERLLAEQGGSFTAPTTFAAFIEDVWRNQYLYRQKPRSQTRCEVALRTQLLPTFGTMRLNRISRIACLEWFDRYSMTAPGGANRTLDVLRQIMNAARRAGYIVHDPTKGIIKNKRNRPMRFLSHEEIFHLGAKLEDLVAIYPHWRVPADIIRLLLLTGCRAGEITSLRWTEIVLDAGGMKLCLSDSKTGVRKVWLGQAAADIIERQPHNRSEFVFPHTKDCRRPITSINWHWRQIRAMSGLDDVRLHDLRHSFASHAVRDGVPLPVVASLLGHANVKMTLRYAHVGDDEVAIAAERVGKAVWEMMGD